MPSKPEILLMDAYPEWDRVELDAHYHVHEYWTAQDKKTLLSKVGANIRAIATSGGVGASRDLMMVLPRLEIVACYGVGTDAIDLEFARQHNIKVTNTPDVLTDDVADMAVALALSAARQIPQGDLHVRCGKWREQNMPLVTRLSGKKVGIVGLGRIGRAVAKRLASFDCPISYFSRQQQAGQPYRFFADLIELATQSEILIVTLAANAATKNIIDANVFHALGAEGIFINVARGGVVDEEALLQALEKSEINAAGLDVFWNEPNIDSRFAKLDNVVLQPHHASGTLETRQAMGKLVRDNLAAHFSSQPLITPVV